MTSILTTERHCLGFATYRRKHLGDKKAQGRTKLSHSNAGAHHYHFPLMSCLIFESQDLNKTRSFWPYNSTHLIKVKGLVLTSKGLEVAVVLSEQGDKLI